MGFWEQYENDADKEINGAWHDFGGGLRLRIGRADIDANPNFSASYQELMQDVTDENETARLLYASLVTEAEGLTDRKGAAMEPTRENIAAVFKALPELYRRVRKIAHDFDEFKPDKAIDDLGKS